MPQSTAQRTANYRDRQKAKGLRPVTLWVLDTRSPEVKERIARDMAALRRLSETSQEERDWDNWNEAQLAEIDGWKA
jgi:hypothetical protein